MASYSTHRDRAGAGGRAAGAAGAAVSAVAAGLPSPGHWQRAAPPSRAPAPRQPRARLKSPTAWPAGNRTFQHPGETLEKLSSLDDNSLTRFSSEGLDDETNRCQLNETFVIICDDGIVKQV